MSRPEPPAGLGEAGASLWVDTVAVYDLTDQELRVLRQACATLDVVAALEEQVASDGVMVDGSKGQPVLHPAVGEARQQRLAFGRLISSLALPDSEGETIRTPEQVRASTASLARWRAEARKGVAGGTSA